jgi:hypothetical protein
MLRTPLAVVVSLGLLIQWVRADDKSGSPDFSRYPQTEVYKEAFAVGLRDSDVLAITAFASGGGFFLLYTVDKNGAEFDVRDVPDFAMEASHSKKLSSDQMKSLIAAIGELPSENAYGSAGYLVVVRTRQGTTSKLRCYDGKNLPKGMRDIYAIIGERFETAGIR